MPRFRVLRGAHSEGGRVYKKGQIVDSKIDLVKRFNSPGSVKFEKVGESTPQTMTALDGLDNMSIKELQDFAASEEIDLKGARTKEEIIKAIRADLS